MPVIRYITHMINKTTYAIEEKTPASQGLCYLLLAKDKALMIDTCMGFRELLPVVKGLTDLPVIVANTHAHVDHIGGNHFFNEIWYHQADRKIFALHTDIAYTSKMLNEAAPLPLRILLKGLVKRALTVDTSGDYHYFDDGHIFHLGGRDIEVIPTPGHTPGSVCFLDRKARMLFTGDSVCEWGILLHLQQESCKPEVFLESMKRLKLLENAFDTLWPGHHGFPVDKSYIDDYLACAVKIIDGTAEKIKTKGRLAAKYGRVLITIKEDD